LIVVAILEKSSLSISTYALLGCFPIGFVGSIYGYWLLKQSFVVFTNLRVISKPILGRVSLVFYKDISTEKACIEAVQDTVKVFGRINILVNNAAVQTCQDDIRKITQEQLETTFKTNIFSLFYFVKAALDHMTEDDVIINSTSVTAYRGHDQLLDYSSTKGAIVTFTRSLSQQLTSKKIRVNAVAPGPIWTPLIPATFPPDKVKKHGQSVPMERYGQPCECASCYVFLAAKDSSYITGQVLHPNGGNVVNG